MEVILSLIITILLWLPIFKVLNHPKSAEIEIGIDRKIVSISFMILFFITTSQVQTLLETYFFKV